VSRFFCFVGAGRLTAFQSAKVIKVNWLCALRKQNTNERCSKHFRID